MNIKEYREYVNSVNEKLRFKESFLSKYNYNLPLDDKEKIFYRECRQNASKIYIDYFKYVPVGFQGLLNGVIFSNLNNKPYEVDSCLTILQEGYFDGSRCSRS